MEGPIFRRHWVVLLLCLLLLISGALACTLPQIVWPTPTVEIQGPPPGEQPPGPEEQWPPGCGDGICSDEERMDPDLCPQDCAEQPPPPEEQPPSGGPPGEGQITFTADRTSLQPGECAMLQWSVQGGEVAELNGEPVGLSGNKEVCPNATTTYTLAVYIGQGPPSPPVAQREVVISVGGTGQPPPPQETPGAPPPPPSPTPTTSSACPGPPVIPSFTANPSTINAGQSITLSWGLVTNATSVVIDQGIGGVGTPGSVVVKPTMVMTPTTTIIYTMTATGCGGTTTKQVTVTVQQGGVKIISADLAVTDLYPYKLPRGEVFTRITNNGPDSLTNASVTLQCQTTVGIITQGFSGPVTVTLNPGQTAVFDTGIFVDTNQFKYDITCSVSFMFDPKASNNSYSENIP